MRHKSSWSQASQGRGQPTDTDIVKVGIKGSFAVLRDSDRCPPDMGLQGKDKRELDRIFPLRLKSSLPGPNIPATNSMCDHGNIFF